jgi:hypothetical protein
MLRISRYDSDLFPYQLMCRSVDDDDDDDDDDDNNNNNNNNNKG